MDNEYAETGFYTKREKSTGSIFCSLLCSHFGLFLVVAVYAVAGAYAFIEIERPHELQEFENKQERAVDVMQTKNYICGKFWSYQNETGSDGDYIYNVTLDLDMLEEYIIESVSDFKYDGTVDGWVDSWTFPKALLLTMTIMSTIGYGHIYPVTDQGKIFCILYSLVGCPLLLIFLGNLGNSIADTFIYIYSRILCRWCRSRRNEEELPPHTSKKQRKLLVDDEVGNEDYMPTKSLFVPIVINLTLLWIYITLGEVLFSFWEGWDLSSSRYFTFVTLSTIGYGDMVPGNAILVSDDDGSGTIKMLICIIYIVLGMALLSTCINLMQEQLVGKCRWLAKEIGLSKPDPDAHDKNKAQNNKNKPTKKKKKQQPSTIPEDAEQGLPVAGHRSPSAGRLRSRRPSQDSVPSLPVESNTLAPSQTLAPIQSESRSPSPFVSRSNCSTPIPGSLDNVD